MPLREPEITEPREKLWRHFQFGNLATLTTLETRHTGRAKQIDYSDHIANIQSQTDADRFKDEILAEPNRTMLSKEMETFLAIKVKESVAGQIPWRLIGNPMPIANMPVPNLAEHGIKMPNQQAAVGGYTPDLLWKGRFNLPFYLDTWDGYPWARERFYNLCAASGATDLIVLTGDSHSFWSNTLQDGAKRQMGVEIGTAGVSSPGDFIEQGFDPDIAARIDQIFAEEIEEVRWTDNLHQGYVKLRLSQEEIQTSYVAVSSVVEPVYEVFSIREERITKKGSSVGFVDPL
jgi:alkaline phosphatase D